MMTMQQTRLVAVSSPGTRQTCPTCEQSIRLPGIPSTAAPSTGSSTPVAGDVKPPASARLALTCPQCGKRAFARGSQLGKTIICENCLEDILVVATLAESPEPSLQSQPMPAVELVSSTDTDDAPSGTPSIRLTSDDLVPESPPPPPPQPPPPQPVDQVYDLGNVDLDNPTDESLRLTDPFPHQEISLEGLAAGPADSRSSEEILNSLGPPATVPVAAESQASDVDSYGFGISCLLCGSRLYVGSRDVGTEVRCPDCHSHTLVREPRQKKPGSSRPRPADEEPIPGVPASMPAGPPADSGDEQLQQSMEAARAVVESEQQEFMERSESGWWATIFSSLFQIDILVRMLFQAITGALAVAMLKTAIEMGEGIQAVLGLFLFAVGGVLLIMTGVNVIISIMTIIQTRADGVHEVENWPSFILLEWIGMIPYIAVALFVSGIPLIAWIPLTHELLPPAVVLAVGSMMTLLLFAPVILATLSVGTPFSILSSTVLASITLRPATWLAFVGFVALVSPAMAGSLALLAQPSAWAAAAGTASLIVAVFFYSHIVGVLGFQISCYRDGDRLDRIHHPADDED
jgi:predicted  nucleic acid-binding Zn-ribbon protein